MKKIKKILFWVLVLILFIVISEILINISLNSSFKQMMKREVPSGVEVYQAESTLVNGRIRGMVENTGNPNIQGKFLKVDIYSKRNVKLGTKYIKLDNLASGRKDSFEVFYKLQNSNSYNISIVDKEEQVDSKPFFSEDFTKRKILLWVAAAIILL